MDDIRKEYTNTLKEIVRLETLIARLKRKAEDLEKCMDAPDDIPPSLDKDGCVYWDHILERTEHHD